MTKKETTIFKIIAGLTILILGALLVYSLIPSSATNSPDKNQEPPKTNGKEAMIDQQEVASSAKEYRFAGKIILTGLFGYFCAFTSLVGRYNFSNLSLGLTFMSVFIMGWILDAMLDVDKWLRTHPSIEKSLYLVMLSTPLLLVMWGVKYFRFYNFSSSG